MKQLIIFQDGTRIIGDTAALVLPQHPSQITSRHELDDVSDEQLQAITANPHNDELLKSMLKENKITI